MLLSVWPGLNPRFMVYVGWRGFVPRAAGQGCGMLSNWWLLVEQHGWLALQLELVVIHLRFQKAPSYSSWTSNNAHLGLPEVSTGILE